MDPTYIKGSRTMIVVVLVFYGDNDTCKTVEQAIQSTKLSVQVAEPHQKLHSIR